MPATKRDDVLKWDGEAARCERDELAEEAPLEIRIGGRPVSVTMRTSGHDEELAAGFLLTEGIISRASDLRRVRRCAHNIEGNVLNVWLSGRVAFDPERLTRHVFASSSCGLCGKATIDAIQAQFPPVASDAAFEADTISRFPDAMRSVQETFDRTGGLHAAAVFEASGRLVVLREDVGRHNAVDKALGHCLMHGPFPLKEHALMVSGRTSFEILQKTLAARVPVVAAVSAPSSLAAEFAHRSGQTLIGFLRGRRMNVYTHARRVGFPATAAPQTAPAV